MGHALLTHCHTSDTIEIGQTRRPVYKPVTNSISPCAFWPGPPHESPTRISNDTGTLIVSTTGDTATTYWDSRAMHRPLTSSHLLTLDGVIAHGVYGEYGNACVDGTVNAYLASGRLPAEARSARSDTRRANPFTWQAARRGILVPLVGCG
ncbi:alpha/beta hydrolase [Streptomyces europaeiscabiei]|uniref:alpha/beta hydrolase n=1 Tax=Streptomyces europaeiscabiei TaxID=146819 RepID=UPI0029A8B45E|nr:alpha/beta hydrolase [Streptomyces europaeiscabiei]MDX2525204.1 alpha/beta hydrolase [Streptomyces europaeiscabiei]